MVYIRIRYAKRGGHYHCRMFSSQHHGIGYAKNGDVVFDEREFADVRDKLSRCEWINEDAPSGDASDG